MKQVLFVLLSIIITNCAFAQGVTKNGKITNIGSEYVNKNGAIGSPNGVDKYGRIVAAISLPTVSTIAISAITSTTAVSGVNVSSDGGATITEQGVCWNTDHSPTTILSTKTTNGTGNITGLTLGTTYYVRAYATNSLGTVYGDEMTFTASLGIGDNYLDGKIFYLCVSGDLGYIEGQIHGLIVAPNDLPNAFWNCYKDIETEPGIGYGKANTGKIINGSCSGGAITAAKECAGVDVDGNWYLPSIEELRVLLKSGIGGLGTGAYWSSTQNDSDFAHILFKSGMSETTGIHLSNKNTPLLVRAIRTF